MLTYKQDDLEADLFSLFLALDHAIYAFTHRQMMLKDTF
jgi:hypothetical protein